MNAFEVKNLTKIYPTFLLDHLSFSIPKGYIMGFIGANGAGKTTTMKAMLNVIRKDEGTVLLFNKSMDDNEIELKKRIGFVSGDAFYPKRKVKEITDVYRRFYPTWDETLYKHYLSQFHIDPNKKIDELSKGMKMKYCIALALSHQAELLILDEPTSGLDPVARDELLEVFQTLVEEGEVSILFSTHITSDLEKCSDYITFIQNGKLVVSTTKDDLIDQYRVVSGSKNNLDEVKEHLISYKMNSLGFTGLIKTATIPYKSSLNYAQPTLDDIMIYYAKSEV